MKIKPLFRWFDMWVGAYWDQQKRRLYILPLPCVGVVVQFSRPATATDIEPETEMNCTNCGHVWYERLTAAFPGIVALDDGVEWYPDCKIRELDYMVRFWEEAYRTLQGKVRDLHALVAEGKFDGDKLDELNALLDEKTVERGRRFLDELTGAKR